MRRPDRAFARLLLLVAGIFFCAPAGAADPPELQLKSVEKALDETRAQESQFAKQAETLAAEIAALRGDSINAAKAAQAHEAALSSLEGQLAALNAADAVKSRELKRHRAQQTQLLMALERLALNPPEGLALGSGKPVDALRSAELIAAAVPPIEAQARALSQEIATLAALRRQIADAEAQHRAERTGLDREQTRLAAIIARKSVLQEQAQQGMEESNQRQMQLASQAADLQQLIDRLEQERKIRDAEAQKRREAEERRRAEAQRREAERQARLATPQGHRGENSGTRVEVMAPPPIVADPGKPKSIRSFAKARGLVVYPASGQLLRRYGESDELGVASKGVTFETRSGGQVIAPFDGRVLFAGPFRGYGQILIIEHSDGYHSLLAGLERIDGTVGQWLVAGEPVGTMPKGEEKPRLYLELRHDGQPINPMPWLATRDEKVSG